MSCVGASGVVVQAAITTSAKRPTGSGGARRPVWGRFMPLGGAAGPLAHWGATVTSSTCAQVSPLAHRPAKTTSVEFEPVLTVADTLV